MKLELVVFSVGFLYAFFNLAWLLWTVILFFAVLSNGEDGGETHAEPETREKMAGDVWGNWATR